jgi:hypothetical protein
MQNRPCSGATVSFEAEAAPIPKLRRHGCMRRKKSPKAGNMSDREGNREGPHWRLAKRNHIDVDAQPTIVLHAERPAHARELARERWLRQALCELKSNGKPFAHPPRSRRCGARRIMRLKPSPAIPLRRIVPTMKSSYATLDTAAGLRSALADVCGASERRGAPLPEESKTVKLNVGSRCGRFNWAERLRVGQNYD